MRSGNKTKKAAVRCGCFFFGEEVLNRPKYHFTKEIVATVVGEIARLGLCVDAEKVNVIMPDPKDRVFYEVVMEERKTDDANLVTGNLKHFSGGAICRNTAPDA